MQSAAEVTAETGSPVHITVRYFAAARAAAGSDSEELTVRPGATV
ncbi:MAG: MoaD/ThiS family protein, partial [Mycobacterium sp.]